MLGQPRGGYGTIIIAWRASMRTAAHKNCPAISSLKKFAACSRRANRPVGAMDTQTKPTRLKSRPAVEERVHSHR